MTGVAPIAAAAAPAPSGQGGGPPPSPPESRTSTSAAGTAKKPTSPIVPRLRLDTFELAAGDRVKAQAILLQASLFVERLLNNTTTGTKAQLGRDAFVALCVDAVHARATEKGETVKTSEAILRTVAAEIFEKKLDRAGAGTISKRAASSYFKHGFAAAAGVVRPLAIPPNAPWAMQAMSLVYDSSQPSAGAMRPRTSPARSQSTSALLQAFASDAFSSTSLLHTPSSTRPPTREGLPGERARSAKPQAALGPLPARPRTSPNARPRTAASSSSSVTSASSPARKPLPALELPPPSTPPSRARRPNTSNAHLAMSASAALERPSARLRPSSSLPVGGSSSRASPPRSLPMSPPLLSPSHVSAALGHLSEDDREMLAHAIDWRGCLPQPQQHQDGYRTPPTTPGGGDASSPEANGSGGRINGSAAVLKQLRKTLASQAPRVADAVRFLLKEPSRVTLRDWRAAMIGSGCPASTADIDALFEEWRAGGGSDAAGKDAIELLDLLSILKRGGKRRGAARRLNGFRPITQHEIRVAVSGPNAAATAIDSARMRSFYDSVTAARGSFLNCAISSKPPTTASIPKATGGGHDGGVQQASTVAAAAALPSSAGGAAAAAGGGGGDPPPPNKLRGGFGGRKSGWGRDLLKKTLHFNREKLMSEEERAAMHSHEAEKQQAEAGGVTGGFIDIRSRSARRASMLVEILMEKAKGGEIGEGEFNETLYELGVIDKGEDTSSLFEALDSDCSGTIAVHEIKTAIALILDPTADRHLEKVVETNTKLSASIEKLRKRLAKQAHRVIELFLRSDRDGNGTITKEEFVEGLLPELGVQQGTASQLEIEQLWMEFDQDDSGVISFAELNRMVRGAAQNPIKVETGLNGMVNGVVDLDELRMEMRIEVLRGAVRAEMEHQMNNELYGDLLSGGGAADGDEGEGAAPPQLMSLRKSMASHSQPQPTSPTREAVMRSTRW